MADNVRSLLEEMIPELEDLEEKGYFSRAEIRQIVKKRTNFEYLLKRRAAVKADYLRYVEYETKLEELRRLRRDALALSTKQTLVDHALVRRVHFIYQRATRKFRGDLALWSAWLAYCKATKSARKFSQVVTKALQLHPREASLWVAAAAWELEQNRNAGAARALMQRGLRMCPGQVGLWAEYFRLELLYAQTLRTRRKVLGIDNTPANGGGGGEAQEGEAAEAAVEKVLSGAVALVVFRGALAELPKHVATLVRFLNVLRPFSFPGVGAIAEAIYSSLEEQFPADPEAWDLLARRWLGPHPPDALPHAAASTGSNIGPAEQAAMATYEEALASTAGPDIYDRYAAFLTERLEAVPNSGDGQAIVATKGRTKQLTKRLLKVCELAAAEGRASEHLLLEWPKLALRQGQVRGALAAAAAGTALRPASPMLWQQRIVLEAQQASSTLQIEESLKGALEALVIEAVKAVPSAEAAELWILGLKTLSSAGLLLDGLLQSFLRCLAGSPKGPLRGGMGEAAAVAMNIVRQVSGLEAARQYYRQMLKLPPAGGSLHHTILDIEEAALSTSDCLSEPQVIQLYEAAVDAYGSQDEEVWLRYIQRAVQRKKNAGKLYWRATKSLDNPQSFAEKYHSLQGQGLAVQDKAVMVSR